MTRTIFPLNPACPVKFFEEDERSEFNQGHLTPDTQALTSDPRSLTLISFNFHRT
jgi:hypothetical protein